jgi:hypothetical protein
MALAEVAGLNDKATKKKVKEFTSNVNNYNNIDELKNNNNKIIADLESIDTLKKSIGDDKLYLRLQNLALLNNKSYKKNEEKKDNKKLIKGKNKIELSELSQFSSETEDYIEVFSNSIR